MTLSLARHPSAFHLHVDPVVARLHEWLEHHRERVARQRLEREAACLRRYAQGLQEVDPGMAADLFAAADRELGR